MQKSHLTLMLENLNFLTYKTSPFRIKALNGGGEHRRSKYVNGSHLER